MKHLNKKQLIYLHSMAIKRTGGLGVASGKYGHKYMIEWIIAGSK